MLCKVHSQNVSLLTFNTLKRGFLTCESGRADIIIVISYASELCTTITLLRRITYFSYHSHIKKFKSNMVIWILFQEYSRFPVKH